ncbi:hypothetical protein BDA99DRAFT_514132 [Phascolomyces articulosus]|uniref:TPR-like protein n=1 Tax=Phascolomyces articulosus TaxID=60185 RepID=A0AAD5JX18_9FUNG|nr:hypothetical protein BDA99DRAFT_514132 [Phascolomyces articulosus]
MEPFSKSLQAAADLDTARCQGNWAVIPELAKRYKKYHPDESVIVATATYEAKFSLFVNQQRKEVITSKGETTTTLEQQYRESKAWDVRRESDALLTPISKKDAQPLQPHSRKSLWGSSNNGSSNGSNGVNKSTATLIPTPNVPELMHESDAIHRQDDPTNIALPPRLNPADTEKYLKALQELIKKHTKSDDLQTKDDRQAQLAKIVVARIYFETGRYDKALESLARLALRMEDVHSGYGMVLLIQARVIKAICFEMKGDIPTAIETYGAAWDVFDQHPAEKGEMLSYWIEECVYRAILLHVRSESPARQVLPLLRGYMQLASSHWSPYWRMHKRWLIFQQYGRFLIKACQEGTYYPMPISSQPGAKVSSSSQKSSKASAYEELLCLTALYRNLLSSITIRSNSQEKCRYVLELANLFVDVHNVIGWGEISNIRRVLQFFQKAKEHTFNSMCISRFIFFTFMRLGNYEEALYSLRSYMELMGLPDIDKTDENGVETTPYAELDISARVELILSKLSSLRHIQETNTDAVTYESENEINVIEVLLAGIQLYGRELRNGKQAAFLGDISVELASNIDPSVCDYSMEEWTPVMVACHRMRGTAYGLYASQTHNPENRAIYHGEALASLRRASDYDINSWKVHYEIALQQAQMKDIIPAIASIGKSLQLKPDHIPSWHLLSLLNSCNQFKQVPQALQTIQAGLQECGSGTINVPTNITFGMPVLSWNIDEKHSRSYHDKCEAYLRLRITQLELLEELDGPDAALRGYGELFSMYTLLAQSLGMSEAQVAVQANESLRRIASINVKDLDSKRKTSSPGSPGSPPPAIVEEPSSPRSTRSSRSKSLDGVRRLSVSSSKRSAVDVSKNQPPPLPTVEDLPKNELIDGTKGRRKSTETLRSTKDKSRKKSIVDIGKRLGSTTTPTTNGHAQPPAHPAVNGLRRDSSQNSRLSIKRGSTAEELRRDSAASEIIAPTALTPQFSLASMRSNSFSGSTLSLASNTSTAVSTTTQNASNNASAFVRNQRERWHQLLVKLWLMSTNTFIKSGRFEEASKAIVEAEQLGLMDAVVWHQLGQLCIQTYKKEEPDNKELLEIGLDAYKKALMLEPDHIQTHVDLASAYMDMNEWELAEGLLERATKGSGWDRPQAWYLLGMVYKQQETFEQAKSCLLYAVELNEATPMGSFTDLPRFV